MHFVKNILMLIFNNNIALIVSRAIKGNLIEEKNRTFIILISIYRTRASYNSRNYKSNRFDKY